MICRSPHFEWYPVQQWWGPCTNCGQLAWSHEQADPLQDVRNQIELAQDPALRHEDFPPTMRPMD